MLFTQKSTQRYGLRNGFTFLVILNWSSRTVERRRVPLVHWWFQWSRTMGPMGISNAGERPVLMVLFMCCNVPPSRPVLHPTASWNDVQPTDKAVVMDEEHKRKLCHSCCKSFGLACKFHRQLISRVRCSFWYKTWIFLILFSGAGFCLYAYVWKVVVCVSLGWFKISLHRTYVFF